MANEKSENTCKFLAVINCPEENRKCDRCGWNPEVDRKRKEEMDGRVNHG